MYGAAASPIHTPIRRPESTINNWQFRGDQEKEWTTARCHRLLRALTSRIAILKKELARLPTTNQTSNGHETAGGRKRPAKPNDDADWTRARKKIRKTYSSKGVKSDQGRIASRGSQNLPGGKGRTSLVPGAVSVPTPFLARVRGDTPGAEESREQSITELKEEEILGDRRRRAHNKFPDPQSHSQMSDTLRDIRGRVPASCYAVYEGIYHGLEALLRATLEGKQELKQPKRKSLMAMTLRAIPQYIAQQEGLLQAHIEQTGSKSAIENRDMSTEIYDELESLGTSGRGWKHLRIIVRSHGIQVICDAIRTGLLDVDFCAALVALCLNTAATEEAQTLISTLVLSTTFFRPKTLYDIANRSLSILWRFTEHAGQASFQYRTLSHLVSHGLLPVEWLATKEFVTLWTGIIQSLAPGPMHQEAFMFLDASLPLLSIAGQDCGKDKPPSATAILEATRNTFSSLLTILTSIVILSREAVVTSYVTETSQYPQNYVHIITLLRSCWIEHKRIANSSNGEGALLLLTNLLLRPDDDVFLRPGVEELTKLLQPKGKVVKSRSTFYNEAVMFICHVGRCCGRGSSTPGFENLEYLHALIEGFPCKEEARNVLRSWIVDSAFAFAKMVPNPKHLNYAATMDAKFCSPGFNTEDDSPSAASDDGSEIQHGFRWEEGIGEWVAATPALHRNKKRAAVTFSEDGFEQDTPYRPPRLQGKKAVTDDLYKASDDVSEPIVAESSPPRQASPIALNYSSSQQDALIEIDGKDTPEPSFNSPTSDDELSSQFQDFGPVANGDRSHGSEMSLEGLEGTSLDSSQSTISTQRTERVGRRKISRAPRLSRKPFSTTRDWHLFDDSLVSPSLSLVSNTRSKSGAEGRDYIDRAPRLGRKALRSNQTWQFFDESDDELSFVSTSSQDDYALKDVTKSSITNATRSGKTKASITRSKSVSKVASASNDSEDELCI